MPAFFCPIPDAFPSASSLPDEAAAFIALDEWLQAATVDELLAWVQAWREKRLWPKEER